MDEDKYLPKEIMVDSFWGAVANIVFFQIVGFCIFQSFIFYLDDLFMMLYGGIWLLVLLYFQSKIMAKIRNYLSSKSVKSATLSLRNIDDWIKFVLTIVFIVIFILFIFDYYPFPQKEYDLFSLIIFYVFSIGIASLFSIWVERSMPQTNNIKYAGSPAGGFVIGFIFLLMAYFFNEMNTMDENIVNFDFFNFYLLGMPGLGIMMICLTIILLKDQKK